MRVRLLIACSLGRHGDTVDVGDADAARLVRKGRAVVVMEPAPSAAIAAPEEVPEPEALAGAAEPPPAVSEA